MLTISIHGHINELRHQIIMLAVIKQIIVQYTITLTNNILNVSLTEFNLLQAKEPYRPITNGS